MKRYLLPIALLLFATGAAGQTVVPGTANTWTDGTHTWAGNPLCNQIIGTGPSCDGATSGPISALLCAKSPAIDAGMVIPDFHCPAAGSALNQPRLSDGTYCQEWYGKAPDIGACEFVPTAATVAPPATPRNLILQ